MTALTPVPMPDRNGKVTTRHVRAGFDAPAATKAIPAPKFVSTKSDARELASLYRNLAEKNSSVTGARHAVESFFEDGNLDALRALDQLDKPAGDTCKTRDMILGLQGMGKVAADHLTDELYEADVSVQWSLIRASRNAEVEFPAGGTPPGWSEVREMLYEDLRRTETLKSLIRDRGVIDPEELHSMLLRVEQHAAALAEGVL